jgi:hypothetical protein
LFSCRRAKQADEEAQAEGDAVVVIDVSAHEPCPIPSKKWRELIKTGVGGGPAAVPEVLTGNAHRFAHREEDVIERILRRWPPSSPAGYP